MKKILIIGSSDPTTQLAPLVHHTAQSHEVTLIHGDSVLLDELDGVGTVHFKKGIPHPKSFGDWFFFALATPFLALLGIIRLIRYALRGYSTVLFTSTAEKLTLTPWARLLRYKVLWYEDHLYDTRFRLTLYAPLFGLYSRMTTVIARSESIAETLTKTYRVPAKKITIIPFGIDLAYAQEQTDIYTSMVEKDYQIKNEALFIIGSITELAPHNGVEFLLKAAQSLKELIPNFQLIIVGDGPEKKNLLWITKMLHLDQHVRFVGKQEHLSRWHNYFDIFISTRMTPTPFSFDVAYAMAAGIPVVAHGVAGVTEIINHQGGIVTSVQSTETLADAIFQLYNDKKQYELFAQQAQQRIRKEYNLELIAQRWTELLHTLS